MIGDRSLLYCHAYFYCKCYRYIFVLAVFKRVKIVLVNKQHQEDCSIREFFLNDKDANDLPFTFENLDDPRGRSKRICSVID